ncbi:phosphoadenosine phosphosulfate reductase domain-containing protein [Paraburkholderia fungorum]|uniref:phosphoadenosine phosphosulfate reductase domain-containing protein n=1 Tax=Paraburkholderia fungorum TaxID=134537 RepID=UPI0018531690|nr:phosphoadenosine phosphosulfate reductase family protein [Paraburkholderia fungorum]MBB5546553.1 3'-phosphoadenosine 5'-phosphosulfate sulfotransferase (PAPS reductase)/FAD synthetase [Paraburkholderia fungorum]
MNHAVIHLNAASGGKRNCVAVTPDVEILLARNCVVAVGVSGGKDSDACAIATDRYLNEMGHTGPRVLVHADLGRVEWRDSLPGCRRLAERLGWELMVVERRAGDMLARWQTRWENNVARYAGLSCVRLILPWSTPAMRFCTSEMKVAQITSALRKRFRDQDIINVSGIRRQESSARAKMPVSAPLAKLQRKGVAGVAWNAIIEWPLEDVLYEIKHADLALHEAYTTYGASRVSCAFCIMSAQRDLRAAASCEDNHDLYRSMVELEADSTFAFQGNSWLADVAPDLLSTPLLERVMHSKQAARERQAIEGELPEHLLFTAGWPTAMPTVQEADLIASVRRRVSGLVGLDADYLTGEDVIDRYSLLMQIKASRGAPDSVLAPAQLALTL